MMVVETRQRAAGRAAVEYGAIFNVVDTDVGAVAIFQIAGFVHTARSQFGR